MNPLTNTETRAQQRSPILTEEHTDMTAQEWWAELTPAGFGHKIWSTKDRTRKTSLDNGAPVAASMVQQGTANILIVDDEQHISEILARLMTAQGHTCMCAPNGETAVKLLEGGDFDLMLADIMMPGMSGIDLLMIARTLFPEVAVVLVTGINDRETALSALELGAYDWVTKPFEKDEILITVAAALNRRHTMRLARECQKVLEQQARQIVGELAEREEEIVFRLTSAVGSRDYGTGAHCRRVGVCSAVIAEHLGWDVEHRELIRRAAPLHDVGKIAIPDTILFKPRSLTKDEFEVVKTHARIGAQLLEGSDVPVVQMAREIALSHHERWDGSGYPDGLQGDNIPESGRIVAVADAFDSLIHKRPYRRAFTEADALNILLVASSTWDPKVFDAFLRALPELRQADDRLSEHEQVRIPMQQRVT